MEQLRIEVVSTTPQHVPIVIRREAQSGLGNEFVGHRFNVTDVNALARFVSLYRADGAECLPLFAALGSKRVGDFESFAALYASAHGNAREPSGDSIRVMRDLLLCSVDRRLQNIYRDLFCADRPKPETSHEQKIARLEATRQTVLAVLNSYDWHWLANWLDTARIGETAQGCVHRLANFAFPVDEINFRFTYHCNIACRHCYNSSGPDQKVKRIARETMLAIIDQMPETGIRHLNLTGGEPFLYPDDVVALIAAGRAAGLRGVSIYTNGFWAKTDRHAGQRLEQLARVGFMQGRDDFIKVSAGIYHQEFIAFDRILILARAYHQRFGKRLQIDFELPPAACSTIEDIRNRINSAGLVEQVKLSFRDVASIGRGRGIEKIRRSKIDAPCPAINQIAFEPDGSIRPCCGLNNENHGIVIGRTEQHCLKTLAKRLQNDPILQFLATHPINEIFAYISTTPKNDGYSGLCELCLDALGGVTDKEPLQAALFDQQKFYPFWFEVCSRNEKVQ